jgi:hypothetical protein
MEAERELDALAERQKGPQDVSIRTVRKFIENLKEMLDGCRNNPRTHLTTDVVKYIIDDITYQGKLINISTSGVCIKAAEDSSLPQKGDEVNVIFEEEKEEDPCRIEGEVIWIGKGNHFGIKFIDLDKSKKKCLQHYMLERI